MSIPCIRCGKPIEHPDSSNSDYITAEDTMVKEDTDVLFAILNDRPTLLVQKGLDESDLRKLIPQENIQEVKTLDEAKEKFGGLLIRCEVRKTKKDVMKTGVICPECFRPTDMVIWGRHKGSN